MECKHGRLRTVGDRVFCCECDKELSLEFLASQGGKKGAEKQAEEAKADKPTPRKRTAKKAE